MNSLEQLLDKILKKKINKHIIRKSQRNPDKQNFINYRQNLLRPDICSKSTGYSEMKRIGCNKKRGKFDSCRKYNVHDN